MTQKLLDGDKIHAAFVVVGRAGPPHPMRAEPIGDLAELQVLQITQPVADRSSVQRPAALIAKQHRRLGQLRPHIAQIPAQDQIQAVQHRHPPRPRPRRSGAFAEADVHLPERATSKVDVGDVEQRCFLRAQPDVIRRAEQRVVPGGGRVFASGGDPTLQEVEEDHHPLHRRWRQLPRRIIADMSRGVELIDRAGQPDPERGLDLDGLAGDQEAVKSPQRLHIAPPGRGRQTFSGHRADHPIHVVGGRLPHRLAQCGEHPLEHPAVVVDRHRAEPAHHPGGDERIQTLELEPHRVHRQPSRHRRRLALDDPQTMIHRAHVSRTRTIKASPKQLDLYLEDHEPAQNRSSGSMQAETNKTNVCQFQLSGWP